MLQIELGIMGGIIVIALILILGMLSARKREGYKRYEQKFLKIKEKEEMEEKKQKEFEKDCQRVTNKILPRIKKVCKAYIRINSQFKYRRVKCSVWVDSTYRIYTFEIGSITILINFPYDYSKTEGEIAVCEFSETGFSETKTRIRLSKFSEDRLTEAIIKATTSSFGRIY